MKFVDFGDLVEVTYDNGNVELVSKEQAVKLGYREQQKITYKGKSYTFAEFSQLTNISVKTLKRYRYVFNIQSGEEIIEKYDYNTAKVKIYYNGTYMNSYEFSRQTGLDDTSILRHYNNGITDGLEIIKNIQQNIERRTGLIQISYQGKLFSPKKLAEQLKISDITIVKYYKLGFHTGEAILQELNSRVRKITDDGKVYTLNSFCELNGYSKTTMFKYYDEIGLRTGEELRAYYNRNKLKPIKVAYAHKLYTIAELSELTHIPDYTILYYYKKGICTGEEIVKLYKDRTEIREEKLKTPRKKKKVQAINTNNSTKSHVITYKGKVYSATQFSREVGIATVRVCEYCRQGLTSGEEIISIHNKRKRHTIKIPYNGDLYSTVEFSQITGISHATLNNYYNQGLRTGEEMIAYYNRPNERGKKR